MKPFSSFCLFHLEIDVETDYESCDFQFFLFVSELILEIKKRLDSYKGTFSSFCLFLFLFVYLVVLIFYGLPLAFSPTIHRPGEDVHKLVGMDQR